MSLHSLTTRLLCGHLWLLMGAYTAVADCRPGTISLQTPQRDLIQAYDQLMDHFRTNQQVAVSRLKPYFYQGKTNQKKTCLPRADAQRLYQAAQSVFAPETEDRQVKQFMKAIQDALEEVASTPSVRTSGPLGRTHPQNDERILDQGMSQKIQQLEVVLTRKIERTDQNLTLLLGLVIGLSGVTIFLLRQQMGKRGDHQPLGPESRPSQPDLNDHPRPTLPETTNDRSDFTVRRPSNSFKTASPPLATANPAVRKETAPPTSTLPADEQPPTSTRESAERPERNQKS